MRKNPLVETFYRAYAAASPEGQAALRVWMRDIVLPRKERRNDLAKSRRSEKNTIAARDRRILEFPLSESSKTVAKILKAEGWYGPKTTITTSSPASGVSVERAIRKTSRRKTRIVQPCLLERLIHRRIIDPEHVRLSSRRTKSVPIDYEDFGSVLPKFPFSTAESVYAYAPIASETVALTSPDQGRIYD